LFNDLLVMFFAKPVKLKDDRKRDFMELAWPSSLLWVSLESKTAFKVIGPALSIVFSSKEKDNTTGASQVAGFHQRVLEVISSERPEVPGAPQKPANPTPGTHFGQYDYLEGTSYVGEWKNGLPHGAGFGFVCHSFLVLPLSFTGILRLGGGLRVEGRFEDGLKHGECKIFFPTGEIYTGSCMKDDQHGVGQIVWPNGDCYNGYWLGGRRDGEVGGNCCIFCSKQINLKGTFVCAYYKYQGSWSDGFMDGEGTLTFNGGGSYVGKFKEGKFHGEGKLVRSNGIITKVLCLFCFVFFCFD
jgi:hypothetical protein